jgi:hypothetical protein
MIRREMYQFKGNDLLPCKSWKRYFSLSEVDNYYEILWDSSDNELLMSDTEYEKKSHKPLTDALSKYKNPSVLSIGYGIGLINNLIKLCNGSLTVMEINPDIIKLETHDIEDLDIIIDDAFICNYDNLFADKKFDIIWWDPSGGNNKNKTYPKERLKNLLTENGQLINWHHL